MRRFDLLAAAMLPAVFPVAVVADAPAPHPFVDPLFSDNMVLQRDHKDAVWGWSAPGDAVTVTLNGQTAHAKTGSDGRWVAKLPSFEAGGPYDLTISGPQSVTFHNVLIGDVWVCSGQSNMEFGLSMADGGDAEIASANYPQIRLFNVPHAVEPLPVDTVPASWVMCTPDNLKNTGNWSGFSAAGYFFGKELNQTTHVPIGLLQTTWGGTPAEAWTSADGLEKMPDFKPTVDVLVANTLAIRAGTFDPAKAREAWFLKYDSGTVPTAGGQTPINVDPSLATDSWKTMALPTAWESAGLPDFDGIVWFRKDVTLTDDQAGRDATLHLGPIDDMDTTWVNGVKVGSLTQWDANRDYKLPAGTLKAGRNVIAIRVLDTGGAGGIDGKPEQMSLELNGTDAIPLAGDWIYSVTADYHKIPAVPSDANVGAGTPTALYNGMIAPLTDFGIKGAIWYQGEANSGRGPQYKVLLPTMITSWRKAWHEGDFPFYIVGLADFQDRNADPKDADGWADIWLAQRYTAHHLKNVGVTATYDIGNTNDIHPKDKKDVGHRLALFALARDYGSNLEYSGPDFSKMVKDGNTLRLGFDHIDGGLTAMAVTTVVGQPPLEADRLVGFQIAGADKKWAWADAVIEGDAVVLSSAAVPDPIAARYCYGSNAAANLYNKAGLPALPFATDLPY